MYIVAYHSTVITCINHSLNNRLSPLPLSVTTDWWFQFSKFCTQSRCLVNQQVQSTTISRRH